jgi:(R,R)-butanediol dehydrogenase/meso-butanediol dehydrogenase/diacetyl reductase
MRAAVYRGARNVAVEEVPDPSPPGADDVIVSVTHASICGTDAAEWWDGPHLVPLLKPHSATGRAGSVVLGHEFVGVVASVGSDVENLRVGDRVVSGAGVSCGTCRWCRLGRTNLCERYYTLGLHADGGLAELVTTPAGICVPVPDTCDDVAAAIAQPLAVARHALDRGGARPGETLAVIGVGGIGSFVIACAVEAGMSPVIAVDVNERRLETARELGASDVVDARSESPVSAIRAATDGIGADMVVEASGAPAAPATAVAATRRGGRVVVLGLQHAPAEIDLLAPTLAEIELIPSSAHVCDADLPGAVAMLARGHLAPAVVDRVIPLDAVVEEGLRPIAERAVAGKIVVDIRG